MNITDIKLMMSTLKKDLDTQLITQSLNKELTDPNY